MARQTKQRCTECGRDMRWSHVALQLERDGLVLVFEDVPALACCVCGEEDIPGMVAEEIGHLAEQLMQRIQAAANRSLSVQRININFALPAGPQGKVLATV